MSKQKPQEMSAPLAAASAIEPPQAPSPAATAPREEAPVPPLPAPAMPLELVGLPIKLKKDEAQPVENTIRWWAIQKQWPAWLAAGMAVGQPVNQEFSEPDIEALARNVAGLPLGRG